MASVHKRRKSKYWMAAWRNAEGKLRLVSTKQTTRSKALRTALEWERLDRELKEGRIAADQAVKVVTEMSQELGLQVEALPTIREWFTGWLRERETHIKDSTGVNYEKAIKDLLAFLKADAEKPLPSLSTARLQSWVNSLSTRGLAAGTVKIYCEPIRAAVTRAWKRGHLTADVAAELELPKRVAAEKDAFTLAELDRLLAAADAEWRIVILASAYAGLRLGDATSLTWREVDLARGLIQLDQGKTGKGVVIPIHPRLRAEIEPLAGDDPDAPLTPGLIGRDSRGTHGLSGQFKSIIQKAGIQVEQRGTGKRKVSSKSTHSLRHTFVRRLMAAGVDESVRMKLAGHASKGAHRVYAQADLDQLWHAVERL
jgi:integrase